MTNTEETKTYCGFAAIIGATNAGKSTLINRLVGHKVSITSRKVQTTRSRVLGLIQQSYHQIILMDTPGIFTAKTRLERSMVEAAWRSITDTGLAVHVVDCLVGFGDHEQKIQKFLQEKKIPAILILNKIDLLEKDLLLGLIDKFQRSETYQDVLLISATQGKGVKGVLERLEQAMPESPFLYDREQISDLPERLLAAEIVREHIFDRLHQEIPYALTVVPELWRERKDGSVEISLCILVKKQGHKGIVIGKGGETLKAIGTVSRKELRRVLECEVHLKLHVKVNARWQDDSRHYQTWGLNFNPS